MLTGVENAETRNAEYAGGKMWNEYGKYVILVSSEDHVTMLIPQTTFSVNRVQSTTISAAA